MNNEIKSIRTYLINKQWVLAKELLLKIHLKFKQNTKILCKLGDCCMKLHEYDLAKQCYTKCINYDNYYFQVKNPKYYLKLAHVYQIYYDPYSIQKNDSEQLYESQLLYQQILTFNNLTDKIKQKCYFNYAQLLTKLKQYNLAQSYYDKLISFNNNQNADHFVHYYYAKLLFIINPQDLKQKNMICYHLEMAINLKPDFSKYYYKYANILSVFGEKTKSSEILSRAQQIEFEQENKNKNKNINKHKKNNKNMHKRDTPSTTLSEQSQPSPPSPSPQSEEELEEEFEEEEKCTNEYAKIDKIELFITMTQSNTHIAHKYINLSNGDLNRAINIFMEDIEKREKRAAEEKKNKWRTAGNKDQTKQKNKNKHKHKHKHKNKKRNNNHTNNTNNNNKPIIKSVILPTNNHNITNQLLPPIVFNDPTKIKRISGVKAVIFDINTLAYLHSFKANKKMSKENIYHTDTLYVLDMFGGRDRIERIKEFFENIIEINIKIIIISSSERSEMIAEALRRVHLFNFFKSSIIAGKEIISEIKPKKDLKLDTYISKKLIWISNYISKKKHLNKNNVVLIDNHKYKENENSEHCIAHSIDHGFDFLLETDMHEIEKRIGCKYKRNPKYQNDLLEYPLNKSLSEINYVLYKDIKFEIINNGNTDNDLSMEIQKKHKNRINIEKYISDKCRNLSIKERQCFFYFFKKFKLLQESQHLHQSWIVLNLCFELMNIESADSDLCRSLAMALSEYQYFADAEFYFKKSLEIFPTNITSLKAYAYFLFMLERYDESSDIFEKALEINPISKKAILGYARSLSFLKEHEKAEIYFKKCIEYYSEWDLAHFRYGKFLYLLERYQEAKDYLLNAVTIWSHSARSHLYLAQCYDKLGDIEEFEFYLENALKLEPEHHEAINKWERHYCKTYNASYFRKKKFVKQAPKIRPNKYNWDQNHINKNLKDKIAVPMPQQEEFKRFWYNHVWFNNDKKKQEYILRFTNTNLNDIRLVLFEKDISTILRSQVGITSNNDIKYILDAIRIYKEQHEEYKEWLVKIKMEKEYVEVLQNKYAIYTLQQMFIKFKSIQDLIRIFGKEQEMTAQYIYKCIQNQKHAYYKQQNQNQHQNQHRHHHYFQQKRNNNHYQSYK